MRAGFRLQTAGWPRCWHVLTAALAASLLTGAAHAGSYFYANVLFNRDIIPGTEQVRIIPGGDFENAPLPPIWSTGVRGYQWPDGTPHIMTMPGVCGKRSWNRSGEEKHDLRREPMTNYDWRVYFSGYGWLPSAGRLRTSGKAPGNRGEQHVCIGWPVMGGECKAMAEGFYFFGDVSSGNCDSVWVPNWNTKGGLDNPKLADNAHRYGYWNDKGQWLSTNLGGDNYADTAAVEFAPPVIRHQAVADFTDYLLADSRGRGVVTSRQFDAAKAVEAMATAARDNPQDPSAQNALAAACIVKFARDLNDFDACKQALAAWDASLKLDPDQPHVRYWRKQYGGYLPPVIYSESKPPPAQAVAASEKAESQMDLTQVQCSYLLMRDIVPGTERVRLAPGGDFSAGLKGWITPQGKASFVTGTPKGLLPDRNPLQPYRGDFAFVEAPLAEGKTAEMLSEPLDLPAGEYVLSAYLSPSEAGFNVAGNTNARNVLSYLLIGLEGERTLFWGMQPDSVERQAQGVFVFATLRLDAPAKGKRLRVATGPWYVSGDPTKTPPHPGYRGDDGKACRVAMLIDNVAVTPASEFRPPTTRAGMQMMLLEGLRTPRSADAQAKQSAIGLAGELVRSDRQGDLPKAIEVLDSKGAPDTPDQKNALGAAAMAQFLRDMSKTDLHAKGLAAWGASLKTNPDQPHIRVWRDVLGRFEPVGGAVNMEFLYPNPYFAKIRPAGGTVAAGQGLQVSIEAVSQAPMLDDCEIRYTTDGSQPNKSSPLYASPIAVDKNTTINAICLVQGHYAPLTTAQFKFVTPAPPAKADSVQGGLAVSYKESPWWEFGGWFKDGQSRGADATAVAQGFDISMRKRDLGVGKSKTQQELMERYLELVKQNPVFKNDPAAGLAVIWVESHGDPAAYRHEPGFYRRYIEGQKQWQKDPAYSDSKRIAASYGAMQVMYTTAVGLGYQGAPEDLYGNKGLEYGSKYYEQQLKKYGDVIDAYAAYNAGSVRKTKEGKYENQANVDKFVEAYKEFKALTDKK